MLCGLVDLAHEIDNAVVDANVGGTKRIEFYSAEKQEKYGVVGIRLELI